MELHLIMELTNEEIKKSYAIVLKKTLMYDLKMMIYEHWDYMESN